MRRHGPGICFDLKRAFWEYCRRCVSYLYGTNNGTGSMEAENGGHGIGSSSHHSVCGFLLSDSYIKINTTPVDVVVIDVTDESKD